jgi:voltage-gated potassium channel
MIARSVANPQGGVKTLILVAATVAYGTAGFMFFEIDDRPELQWVDALWWAIVTMTTVGFGDWFPLTLPGKLLVGIPTMLIGMGVLGYGLSQIAAFFLRAERLNRKGLAVQKSTGHTIVCNYTGVRFHKILAELRSQPDLKDAPVVLVDERLEEIDDELAALNVKFVRGHPARSETLQRAAVNGAARAIVLAHDATQASSDDLTVAVCLMLSKLRPELHVVAECVDPDNRELLERAGCNSVVCVIDLAPGMLVHELHDPGVVDVLQELAVWHEDLNNVFVVPVTLSHSHTIADLREWSKTHNATVLGIRSGDGIVLNPASERHLATGDAAIVITRSRPDDIRL